MIDQRMCVENGQWIRRYRFLIRAVPVREIVHWRQPARPNV